MATFTRVINERVGAVVAVNTYSMRGNFTPDEALRALSKIGEAVPVHRVDPIVVNIGDAFENLARYEAHYDERVHPAHGMGRTMGFGHPNCRSTIDPLPTPKSEVQGIMAARAALRQAVKDGKPYAERKRLARRITTLLKARTRRARGLSKAGMRKVLAIRKRNRRAHK